MVDLYEAKMNNHEINIGKEDTANVYINSGTSVNYIPETPYNFIIDLIKEEHDCL